ncbi:YdfR family protein [Escherichia coli]|nr:YdfR family protein [Escherichia coli]MCS0724629.1 YdfR family protein [Escherichia coli]MCS0768974.1 YdfR family protein [Escherichia coli]MCS0805965.1 YdfR family protein [Escherichia coli]MCS1076238.1 YdfR family protein [Escherichia coli]MCS1105724.1 YdfR family protein [Escherichia coli]
MTQDYELVVKGVRNFENKVTVTGKRQRSTVLTLIYW